MSACHGLPTDRFLDEGVPAKKLLVVPNGVDPRAYVNRREELRQRFGLEARCVLGFVGSFQPWHRVDLLVDALGALIAQRPVHLMLVGEGPGRASMQSSSALKYITGST